jgi:DNA-binding CsgD family transcriptional regulator
MQFYFGLWRASHIDKDIARPVDPFVAAIEAIYDAAPDPTRWPHALQKISDVFQDVGTILIWHRDNGGFGTIVSPHLLAAQKDYEENGWFRRDSRAIRAVERLYWARSDAVTERHFTTDEEIAVDPFYTGFLAQHGLKWCAAVGVNPDPHIAAAVSVQRAGTKQPYSDAEVETIARLGCHVEKSLRLSIRLLNAEMVQGGLGEALSRLNIGVFALDSLGRVTFSNPAGERLLGDGLDLVNDRLRIGDGGQCDTVERAFRQTIRGEVDLVDPKPILVRRAKSERPLAVYLLPISVLLHPADQFLTHARAMVLAIDPEAGAPPDPAIVRDVLGLTLGEARVAALIGSGLPPRAAAEKLGITEESARTVLKRVFSKVGVARQSELVELLTRLVLR